jgi:transposase
MDNEIDLLREQLRRERPAHRQQGWPVELRRRIARHAVGRHDGGECWRSIGESLGLCRTTIRSWARALEEAPERTELVPVVVTPAPSPRPSRAPSRMVLVSPRGYRLEGMDLAMAVDALERLG